MHSKVSLKLKYQIDTVNKTIGLHSKILIIKISKHRQMLITHISNDKTNHPNNVITTEMRFKHFQKSLYTFKHTTICILHK